jgi:hypothetical protein
VCGKGFGGVEEEDSKRMAAQDDQIVGIGAVLEPSPSGNLQVTRLVPGGPAQMQGGINVGDMLTMVDGVDVDLAKVAPKPVRKYWPESEKNRKYWPESEKNSVRTERHIDIAISRLRGVRLVHVNRCSVCTSRCASQRPRTDSCVCGHPHLFLTAVGICAPSTLGLLVRLWGYTRQLDSRRWHPALAAVSAVDHLAT